MTKEEINEIPVYFCTDCLSLKIRDIPNMDQSYCEDCNSANIKKSSIYHWDELYQLKYGYKFLDKKRRNKNGRR